jgi:hypothetical protein
MSQKQPALMLLNPWPATVTLGSHLRKIMAKLKRATEISAGYQDDHGFQFGLEPARQKIQWPPD